MALQLYADGSLIYDSRLQNYKLLELKTTESINKSGTATFTMPPNHPAYNRFISHRTVVELYENDALRFRGRALFPSDDWLSCRTITCEGERGFLRDGIHRPYLYQDTPAAIFSAALKLYNAEVDDFKRFTLGTVTVTDPNDYVRLESESATTFAAFFDKLVERCGGYITFSDDGTGGRAINWLAEIGTRSLQAIEFGENLLDFARSGETPDLATAIRPYGARLEDGTLVTIESVTDDGADWIKDADAIKLRGVIMATVTWDDVTQPANLLTKAQQWLAAHKMAVTSLELSAADLSKVNRNIGSYHVGDMVQVVSKPHNVNEYFQLTERTTDWLDPSGTKVGLGKASTSLVGLDVAGDRQSASDLDKVKQQAITDINKFAGKLNALENKVNGIDGTYFYIKYSAYEDGQEMTDAPNEKTAYMGTCSTNEATAPTDHKQYTWVKIKGKDGADGKDGTNGEPGQAGEDGKSQYFHVKYSDDGKTFTANNGETLGDWLGTCVNDAEADPTDFSAYTWRKIVGDDGENGIDGVDGKDGESAYFYVKFSANSNGYPMTETPNSTTKYMGVCSSASPTAPTSCTSYRWTQCRGNDGANGTPGATGADGKTQYLHIKYSDDGKTFTTNNGEELGAWIGTLVDFNEADSTNFNDYTWKKFTEDVDEELADIRQTIEERYTQVLNDSEQIILAALESYTEKGSYEEFKQTVESQLRLLSDELTLKFTETIAQIEEKNGDLQSKYSEITKYFTFTINGMTIGAIDNPNKVVIDNDEICIMVNGVAVQKFDATGRAKIPELDITKALNLFGYMVEQDANGNVNCEYIGG